jgi:hypothetical protein
MFKKKNIATKNLYLIFGILISAIVLLQAAHVTTYEIDGQEQSDQTESNEEAEIAISPSQAIPNSTSQINLGFDSYLLNEVTFNEEVDEKSSITDLIVPSVHKAIQVLLARIVSPNAP